MKWTDILQDERYTAALPEEKSAIFEDWYDNTIRTDPRYLPELESQIRNDLLTTPPPAPPLTPEQATEEIAGAFASGYTGESEPLISPYAKEVIKGFPKAAFHEIKETLSKISPSIEPEDYDVPAREKTYWKILKEPVMDIGGAAVVPRGTNLIQKVVSLYLLGYAANSIAQGLGMTYQIKKPELSSIMQTAKFRILSMIGKRPVTTMVPYDAVAAYKKGVINLIELGKASPAGFREAVNITKKLGKGFVKPTAKVSVSTKIFKPVVVKDIPKPTKPTKPVTAFKPLVKVPVKPVTPKVAVKPVSLVSEAKKYKTADVTVFPTGKENVLAEIKEAIKKAPGTLRLGGKGQAVETYEKEGLLSKETPTWFAKDPAKGDLAKVDLKIDGGLSIVNDKAALWEVYQKVKATAPKLPASPKPKKISVPKGKGREAIVEGFKKDIVVFEKKIDRLEREEMGIEYADLTPKQKKDRRELIKKNIAYFKESLKTAKENIRFKGIKPVEVFKPKLPTKVLGKQQKKLFEPTKREPEEAGFIKISGQLEGLKKAKDKLITAIDVEYPFKQMGAAKTGLQIKTILSKRAAGEEKALLAVKELGKFKLNKQDFSELAFVSEQPGKFVKLSPEMRKKYSPAYKHIRKYFDDYWKVLNKRLPEKFQLPWPKSRIKRNVDEITHLNEALKKAKDSERKAKVKNQIIALQNENTFLKSKKIQFVHIPVRLWLADKLDKNPALYKQLISGTFKGILGRETLTIDHLVQAGMVSKGDVDIRDIMASYGRYVENQLAQLDILDMAKAEGKAKFIGEAPDDWVELPVRMAPALKGYKLEPVFAEALEKYFESLKSSGHAISRFMAIAKMFQFINPLFLPMYDVVQAGMLGSLFTPKMPLYLARGIRDVAKKTPAYFEAYEKGLYSTPFTNPFAQFQKDVDQIKKLQDNSGNYLLQALDKIKEDLIAPPKIISDIYNLNWGIAWGMDKVIRMMSYNYLLDKGFIPEEAAQLAAKFHADYACYSEDTEILTKNGWKFIKDVKEKELVLTLNPKTKEIEYQPTLKKYEYNYQNTICHYHNPRLDFMVTPNHKLPVRYYKNNGKIQFLTAEEMINKNNNHWSLLVSGKWKGKDLKEWKYKSLKIPIDVYAAFMGIYLSEGDLDNRGGDIRIYQKEQREDFQKILNKMPVEWKRNKKSWRTRNKDLWEYLNRFGKVGDKYVPQEIKELSPDKIRIFIDFYGRGDGSFQENGSGYIYTISKEMANDLQELIVKAGWNSHLIWKKPQNSTIVENGKKRVIKNNGGYGISIKKGFKYTTLRPEQFKSEFYNGKVYCVNAKNNIIYVRRNGTPCFNGNSVPPKTRKLLNKIWFTPTFEIVMNKLYIESIKNAATLIPKMLKKTATPTNKIYARSLLYMAGILFGKDALITRGLGFERQQFSRRYFSEFQDEQDQTKEVVLVFANPANLWNRYYYSFKPSESDTNILERTTRFFRYKLHPVYQLGIELAQNKRRDFKPVYNPFDDPEYIVADILKYSTGRIVRLTEEILKGGEDVTAQESFKALQQATNELWGWTLRPITFRYIRNLKDRRKAYELRKVTNEFEKYIIKATDIGSETWQKRIENYQEKMERISER